MDAIQGYLLLPSSPNQPLLLMDEELWLMAEERIQEILCTIQPNVVSEVKRKQIINFVKRLIGDYHGREAFVFGSVPLKTYLPDGDIDLTVLSHESVEEEVLAQKVCDLLGSRKDREYEVKDIQQIHAQVKVVKCTVKNLAVDISFNQMAGLYTLRFLEQVDQLAGKNHIFKHSLLLVKAWCYYESRILGAHHGLLSTYAVEILVLYIINCFHSSLHGSLEVLYRFLDYYSTFDWENNYITIDGPQALSYLPEIVEKPECERGGMLLNKELLKIYRDMCSVPKASETSPREFPIKCMNIMDPLKNDNNLGRSVHKGNLHRIQFALNFGAQRLKEILMLPGQNMGAALQMFFTNTLNRNGKGQRADVDVPVPAFGTGRSEEPVLVGDCDSYYAGLKYVHMNPNYDMPPVAHLSSPSMPFDADLFALQQNGHMYYRGADLYFPRQALFNQNAPPPPIYSVEEIGKSRGTGTYIPDMTLTTYWNVRARGFRQRRLVHVNNNNHHNNNVSQKSLERKKMEEVPPETDLKANNSRSFELSKEDFPLLSSIGNTSLSASQKSKQDQNSSLPQTGTEFGTYETSKPATELSLGTKDQNEDFGVSSNQGASYKSFERKQMEEVPPETDLKANNSRSFELSKEDFPLLSSTGNTSLSASQKSEQDHQNSSLPQIGTELGTYGTSKSPTELSLGTKDQNEDSGVFSSNQGASHKSFERKQMEEVPLETDLKANNSRSFELSEDDDFPLLSSIANTRLSASQKSKQDKNSSSPQIATEFGTSGTSKSPTVLSLGTKDQNEDSGVSSSQGATSVVPSSAAETKEKCTEVEEKMD